MKSKAVCVVVWHFGLCYQCGNKEVSMLDRTIIACAALFVLLLGACTAEPPGKVSEGPTPAVSGLEKRVQELERRLQAVQDENGRRFKEIRDDLAALKTGMDGIASLLGQEKESAEKTQAQKEKDELDGTARRFARESMERMLDLSRKIMEKLEQELDGVGPKSPAPETGAAPEGKDDSSI